MKIFLRKDFQLLWQGRDPFEAAESLTGKVYRELEGRRTLRFEVDGKGFFLKLHRGVGWKEIVKNLLQGRKPILGARNEKEAVERLSQVGVSTMTIAAFGERGGNPATQQSFIVTEAIEPSISLEDLAIQWRKQPPTVTEKRRLLAKVCDMTRRMHDAGVNHRDFYICHFLMGLGETNSQKPPELSLIDLHRALVHTRLPYRWRLKDLASLYYSAFDVPLTQRDKLRFIRAYSNLPLREALKKQRRLWQDVERKAAELYAKALRKGILR